MESLTGIRFLQAYHLRLSTAATSSSCLKAAHVKQLHGPLWRLFVIYDHTFGGANQGGFIKFLGLKNWLKMIFLAAMAIVELFASHVPRRMLILSAGDGLEGSFQTVFLNFSTNFKQFFFINWECHMSISGLRPSQKLSPRLNVLTSSRDEFPQAFGF